MNKSGTRPQQVARASVAQYIKAVKKPAWGVATSVLWLSSYHKASGLQSATQVGLLCAGGLQDLDTCSSRNLWVPSQLQTWRRCAAHLQALMPC